MVGRPATAFFSGGATRQARLWLAALLGLCVAVGFAQVFLSYAIRDFITALIQRDHAAWERGVWKFIAICFISVPVGVFYRHSQERLSLTWRRWLTQLVINRYFFNRAYCRIRASQSVDNPDQRARRAKRAIPLRKAARLRHRLCERRPSLHAEGISRQAAPAQE
jgi:putative ATP-binding cassette transporter